MTAERAVLTLGFIGGACIGAALVLARSLHLI